MRGMWQPHKHGGLAPDRGGLATSTGDAPTRGLSARGRLVAMIRGGDTGTATAPSLAPRQAAQAVSSDGADGNLDVSDRKTVIFMPRHCGHSSWRQ